MCRIINICTNRDVSGPSATSTPRRREGGSVAPQESAAEDGGDRWETPSLHAVEEGGK